MLNNGNDLKYSKKTPEGKAERRAVLNQHLLDVDTVIEKAMRKYPRKIVQQDDFIDALVLLQSARAVGAGHYQQITGEHPKDAKGIPMRMVFPNAVQQYNPAD